MTYNELYSYISGSQALLKRLDKVKGTFKFSYALNKNKEKITSLIKGLSSRLKNFTEDHKEYTKDRDKIKRKYKLIMDKEGDPVKTKKLTEECADEIASLDKKYESCLKEVKEIQEENIKQGNSEAEITFHKIKEEWIPKELSVEQLEVLMPFLDESCGDFLKEQK